MVQMASRISTSSVDAVMGKLFSAPSRFTGPRPRSKSKGAGCAATRGGHLARVASRRPGVMFKNISRAGAQNARGLRGQMRYIFDKEKVGYVFDSKGRYEGQDGLSERQIRAVARSWEATWQYKTNLGNTSHMLISFPPGVDPDRVIGVAQDVCQEMFGDPDTGFDYVAALHTDTQHPHVHIILNRFGRDGQLFKLSKDSAFSYEAFRELIVERADEFGIKLSNHRRFERGHADRPQSTDQVQEKKRDQTSNALASNPTPSSKLVLKDVSETSDLYTAVAFMAGTMNLKQLQAACLDAANTLNSGQAFTGDELTMSEVASEAEMFDHALVDLKANLDGLKEDIGELGPEERPQFERLYGSILHRYSDLVPETDDAKMLRAEASFQTPYREGFIIDKSALFDAEVREKLTRSIEASGVDPNAVIGRLRIGADCEYLEQVWMASDAQEIAVKHGLDLSDKAEMEKIVEILQEAYGEVSADLLQYGAASLSDEYRSIGANLSLNKTISTPLLHDIGLAELQLRLERLSNVFECDIEDDQAIAAEITEFASDMPRDEAITLAAVFAATQSSIAYYDDMKREQQQLEAAGVPQPVAELAVKVGVMSNGEADRGLLVPLRSPSDQADDAPIYREAFGIDHPSRGTIRAYLEAEAPTLNGKKLDELADRLHRGYELASEEAIRQPDLQREDALIDKARHAFEGSGAEIADDIRAELVAAMQSRMTPEEKQSAESGDKAAMSRFSQDPKVQMSFSFTYVKELVSQGRTDLSPVLHAAAKDKVALAIGAENQAGQSDGRKQKM